MIQRKPRLFHRFELSLAKFISSDFEYFHTLNISVSGALVASYNRFTVDIPQQLEACIDIWLEHFPTSIYCQANVVRIVNLSSPEIKKSLSVSGEDPDISEAFAIQFQNMSQEDSNLLDNFLVQCAAKHSA